MKVESRKSEVESGSAKSVARELYIQNELDFEGDLREYEWPNGVIVDEPDCFGIAFATKTVEGEWAWFVKVAVGELSKLLTLFPARLPFILFCREKTGRRMKMYRLDRLIETARKFA